MEMNSHGSSCSSLSDTTIPSSGHDYDYNYGYEYEVFLSFRGPDTRAGFADHLYHSLRDTGVHVFRDNEEVRVGEEISTKLTEAIYKSKISIPIFSVNYASSKWCLEELVHIAESRKTGNQIVMPIFYNVSPSDVRNQRGSFEDSFRFHESSFSKETVQKWKGVCKEIGIIRGWDLSTGRESEAEVIKEVVKMALRLLKKSYLVVTDFVVGVENHVEKIKTMISVDSREVKIIVIHGMGGIGKTTLAKIIYNELSHDYEGCSFLPNVRETSKLKDKGIVRLQNQLIAAIPGSEITTINSVDVGITTIKKRLSKKKVLVCLDVVSKRNQLKALVGDINCFGPGSRIIITTRNKELLNEVGVHSSYEVTELDFNLSLQLFSKHAFRRDHPPLDYVTYSEKVVKLTGGLPLALEVIGSLLHGKPKNSWRVKLEKLENVPHEDVEENLKISYEELDIRHKQIFLDVACFFVGFDKTMVLYFWNSNLYPEEGMEVLEHMSLLKINEDDRIWMHDQLIDFGKSMICEKGNMKHENGSRFYDPAEGSRILKKTEKEEIVEAMFIEIENLFEYGFTQELFSSVSNLIFLQVDGAPYCNYPLFKKLGIGWQTWTSPVVLPELRWLSWHGFDPLLLRIKLSACNLVILDLSDSKVTHKWGGWSQIKAATNLKILNLSSCHCLTRTPSFSTHLCLERLILSYCSRLLKLDESIGQLNNLFFLDLRSCSNLRELPEEIGHLEYLMELLIDGSGVTVLPDSFGNLKSLIVLRLNDSAMTKLPTTIGNAKNLELIYAERCYSLRAIPVEIGMVASLSILKITGLGSDVYEVPKLPKSLICLHLHFQRHVSENEVPDLSNLVNLRELDLRLYYHRETPWLWWIGRLSKLETLLLTAHGITHLSVGNDLGSLSLLKRLHLINCHKLQSLPRLPSSLLDICIDSCHSMETAIDISNLSLLLKFEVYSSAVTEICGLSSSLVEVHLKGCQSLKTFGDISNLKMLSEFRVFACAVTEIWGLDCLENLQILELQQLHSLETLPADLGRLSQLTQLKLPWLQGLSRFPSCLESLHIDSCSFSNTFFDISNLKRLSVLTVSESTLREIQGLEGLENLQYLKLQRVVELEGLSDLASLSQLKELYLHCPQLLGLPGLPPNLVKLFLRQCPIKKLDVSNVTLLQDLTVINCGVEEIRGLHCLVNLYSCQLDGDLYHSPKPQSLGKILGREPYCWTVTD